jgi:hypothetical protein
MELTDKHKKLIYNAVRYYQTNRVGLNSQDYVICDEILNNLFKDVKLKYVEPAYEINTNE